MKKSEIKFTIELDENHIPETIKWEAEGSEKDGANSSKAVMLALWDQDARAAHAALARVSEIATDMQAAGLLDGQTPAQVAGRVTLASDLKSCVKNALHVQENVSENVFSFR